MIGTLIVCLTILVLAERARPLVVRLIKLKEYAVAAGAGEVPSSVPPFPPDLQARVDACKEGWERSDVVSAITEHFLEARALVATDDEAWIAVRQRLRPEPGT